MNPILKNILAVMAGITFGSLANMGTLTISGSIIPPPEGADVSTIDGLKSSLHLFQPKHFVFPFLAHAFGTFAGAIIAALIAFNHKMKFALGIGAFFLIGGITNTIVLPSPAWFTLLDLIVAYIPMAYLAGKLVLRKSSDQEH